MKLSLFSILIFIFAFRLCLWHFNEMGRWSDEEGLVDKGHKLVELIKQKDFSNKYWYEEGADHPPFASYIYGLASYRDIVMPVSHEMPNFQYDLKNSRMVSVVVFSLTVVLVFIIGA